MADKQFSYDYIDVKRDVSEVFNTILAKSPVFTSILNLSAQKATATKHEWKEFAISPVETALNAAYTAADWSITVDSTVGFAVGDIIDFENDTTKARVPFSAKVTAVTSATVLAISVYDGTDTDMPDNSIVFKMASPKNEGTDPVANIWDEPNKEYNYTQIFDRTAKVSKTAENIGIYGIWNTLNFQVEYQLQQLAYEMEISAIRGVRKERSASEAWTMGGLLWYLNKATGNKLDVSWALTADAINSGMEIAHANGAPWITTIIGHPVQTRKTSALTANYQQVQIVGTQPVVAGVHVKQFVSDQWDILNIMSGRHFDKDKINIINPELCSLVPLRAFSDENAASNWSDYVARRILWEYTMEVKNAADAHVQLTNLTV